MTCWRGYICNSNRWQRRIYYFLLRNWRTCKNLECVCVCVCVCVGGGGGGGGGGGKSKDVIFRQYRKSHCGDKTVLWPSYLYNGISYSVSWHILNSTLYYGRYGSFRIVELLLDLISVTVTLPCIVAVRWQLLHNNSRVVDAPWGVL